MIIVGSEIVDGLLIENSLCVVSAVDLSGEGTVIPLATDEMNPRFQKLCYALSQLYQNWHNA